MKKGRYVLISVSLFTIIFFLNSCDNSAGRKKITSDQKINGISIIKYSVAKIYPHSTEAYTEGFLFHDGKLFESTGSPENYPSSRSVIGITDLKTGKIDVKIEIDRNKYFGEGILFSGDKLYQLTYKNQIGFIYDAKNFRQTGTFTYANKEGWGMTTDGEHIIMSDGTNFLTYLDKDSLKPVRKLNISYNGAPALYANELEYINGFIYANIWTTNYIVKIDPSDGKIVGILDLTNLALKAGQEYSGSEVTNGIAWDREEDKIYVTGKFWPFIYQIDFRH